MPDGSMPVMNALGEKMRAKHMEEMQKKALSAESSMRKREKKYVGLKLAEQSEDHKGAAMKPREKSYEGPAKSSKKDRVKPSEPRAKSYEGPAKTSEKERVKPSGPRGKSYKGPAKSSEKDRVKPSEPRGKSYTPKNPDELKQRDVYARNFEFSLEIDGNIIKCTKISNLSFEQEMEEVQEGGNDLFPVVLPAPKKKADRLVIERALVPDKIAFDFAPGVEMEKGTITVKKNSEEYIYFQFDQGIVSKCDIGDLDAMGREIMMEKIEIIHSGLKLVKKGQ